MPTSVSSDSATMLRKHTSTPRVKIFLGLTAIGAFALIWTWPKPHDQPTPTVNWSRRPCDDLLDLKIADRTKDDSTPIIKFTSKEGCYAGDFKLPEINWDRSEEFKSRNPGDWMSVWCEGRAEPSRIYYWYEDFHDEFLNCRIFSLQGKGWIAFRRNY